jgi:hypothetical protein
MANYSILVDVNLQTKQIQEQLNKVKGAKIDLDTSSIKQASKDIQDLELNFNLSIVPRITYHNFSLRP